MQRQRQWAANHEPSSAVQSNTMQRCQLKLVGHPHSSSIASADAVHPQTRADLHDVQGVMVAVWQGSISGKPYAIAFCLAGMVCNGAMMTFSGKVLLQLKPESELPRVHLCPAVSFAGASSGQCAGHPAFFPTMLYSTFCSPV